MEQIRRRRSPRIAIVGSLNMDLVVSAERMPRIGETISGSSIHYVAGGKGANQAIGCARLGADVQMIGAVGNDAFGQRILREMSQSGANTDAVAILDNKATGIAAITRTLDDNSIIIVPGANAELTSERVRQHRSVIEQADLLLVQLEIPLNAVKEALQLAREAGVTTVLNPAPAQQLPTAILQLADYITPNETEFAQLAEYAEAAGEDAWIAALAAWEKTYGQKVVLTRGKQGAAMMLNGQLHTVQAPPVEVVDTTGAGDCLNAAFGFGLASGWDALKSLRLAVTAASISVGRFGAQAGMPTLSEIESAVDAGKSGIASLL
ncbi:ribokinase [Paenibacillus paridis]|uniref:ribokinase n=1 Tax=Paenibacillus paridis TaxID=2583376 RepID=UPI00111D656C|nr:ribokinase [Paenibacillus paridis]